MKKPFPNLEAPVAPTAAPRNLAARVRADRDLPAAGAHAEARGGFPRGAEAVGVAIGGSSFDMHKHQKGKIIICPPLEHL